MTHGDSRTRRQRPHAPRGVCIGVGAVLSATGGTLLTVAAAGVLGGGALVTTAFAGGRPHAAIELAARPATGAIPPPVAVPAPVAPASVPPVTGGHVESAAHETAPVTAVVASAPAPPPPPVTAAPPPPPPAPARARAIAIPVTGAAGRAAPLTGAGLLGGGVLLLLRSLRRPSRRPQPFDDAIPAYW